MLYQLFMKWTKRWHRLQIVLSLRSRINKSGPSAGLSSARWSRCNQLNFDVWADPRRWHGVGDIQAASTLERLDDSQLHIQQRLLFEKSILVARPSTPVFHMTMHSQVKSSKSKWTGKVKSYWASSTGWQKSEIMWLQ